MALEYQLCRRTFAGTGNVSAYLIDFPVLDAAHIAVSGTTAAGAAFAYTQGVDYAVALRNDSAGNPAGATVMLSNPLAPGWRMTVRRTVPLVQEAVFANQGGMRPKAVERALDYLTMIAQQQNGASGDLEIALAAETAARTNADAALQGDINAEAGARSSADANLSNIKADKTALTAETTTRQNADATLQTNINAEATARTNADAALRLGVAANRSEIVRLDALAMPRAPADGGRYVASGDGWALLDLSLGDPFAADGDGDAVLTERPAYLPNAVWDVRPDELVLSEASRPGDMDSMFIIDADGDAVVA